MIPVYKIRAKRDLHPSDPLHVGNFYPDIQRRHRGKMQDRQDLILYLAQLHATAVAHCLASSSPRGFCEVPMRLMTLRDWVHDYRTALDYFFVIKQTGYNFGDNGHEVSILTPRDLGAQTMREHERMGLEYLVPPRVDGGIPSKVYIHQQNADTIRRRITDENLAHLRAAVEYLLKQQEVNFIFQRSGRLQQRDTSIWPISAVETWPSWLREALFGSGIDIESAYTQFLLLRLKEALPQQKIKAMYPDLVRSVHDKQAWRDELCQDVLGLPLTDANISIVKQVCMSLANGSKISPAILQVGHGFSITADIVIQSANDVSLANLERIGMRLQSISRQYSSAKKMICLHHFSKKPSLKNQKLVFTSYFQWEREARYQIWEACGHHGIMVHDGIDGIPPEYTRDLPALIEKIGLKITS